MKFAGHSFSVAREPAGLTLSLVWAPVAYTLRAVMQFLGTEFDPVAAFALMSSISWTVLSKYSFGVVVVGKRVLGKNMENTSHLI